MHRRVVLVLILAVVLVIVVLFLAFGSKKNNFTGQLFKAADISEPAPVQIENYQGTIASFNNSVLSVRINGQVKTFNIAQTQDIQAIVAGKIETYDAVTVKTSKSDLVANKEVSLYVEKGSNIVRSIYIIK